MRAMPPAVRSAALMRRSPSNGRPIGVSIASMVLVADAAGRFHGSTALAAGQWDLVIELKRGGAQMFLSKNRVVLK